MILRKKTDIRPILIGQLRDVIDRATRIVESADPATLSRRPAPGRWSAAECIDHLNVSARLYLDPFAAAIERARAEGLTRDRPDGRTLLGRLITWTMEPPARFKMKTFSDLEPAPDHDPRALLEEFESLHRALIDQLDGAGDVDGKKLKVQSSLDPRLKLSLHDWYAFLAAHARRHLWQAEQALTGLPNTSEPRTA